MSMLTLTAADLSQELGIEIPDIFVVVAKHEVQGFDSKTIAKALGVEEELVLEAQEDESYKAVLRLLRAEHAKINASLDLSYDTLESLALGKLIRKVEATSDPDLLLKVASMANKATRRAPNSNVLDPGKAGTRVPLTLTRTFTQRLTSQGTEHTVEESVSIMDGSVVNPSFDEVEDLLQVRGTPHATLPAPVRIKMSRPAPTRGDLERALDDQLGRDFE